MTPRTVTTIAALAALALTMTAPAANGPPCTAPAPEEPAVRAAWELLRWHASTIPPPAAPPPAAPSEAAPRLAFYDARQASIGPAGLRLGAPLADGVLHIGWETVNQCAARHGLSANHEGCRVHEAWNGCTLNVGCEAFVVLLVGAPSGAAVQWSVERPGVRYEAHGPGGAAAWFGAHPVEVWGSEDHIVRAMWPGGSAEARLRVVQA